jgi:cell division control protein 24
VEIATKQPIEGAVTSKRTKRQHIVEELVTTERTYVQHLELLQDFKKLVEEKGVISGDIAHNIFLNLNALLDFQRRFLIRVEQVNALPEEDQDWASPFILYQPAFSVYEPYIANQKRCEQLVVQEYDKLRETGGPQEMRSMVESPTVLSAFLLKPFQRLTKYPLLLRDLRDKGEADEAKKESLTQGIAVAEAILRSSNAAIDQQERNEAVQELRERVEDWKGHRLDNFGELLLHGTFSVIKGESSSSKDQEREVGSEDFVTFPIERKRIYSSRAGANRVHQYKIYLFAMILLCCKEMDPKKQKNKVMGNRLLDRKGRPRLQLKGRIFMQNVTDTVMSSKPGMPT